MSYANTQVAGSGPDAMPFATPNRKPSVMRWFVVFWPLAAVIMAGATVFRGAVADSINSTPHPELVYSIFAVAIVAAALLILLMRTFLDERVFIDELLSAEAPVQDRMMQARDPAIDTSAVYSLILHTRGRPVAERHRSLEHEVDTAESQLMARLALPNMLAGSLVGLGLVGTFIGLLATLQDLSGVFAALGGGNNSGGDAASMFSNMIERLKGPMQGMGTAFVASLYGLLGSLIMGLLGVGVKREGERLFGRVRTFVSEELYRDAARATQALPLPGQAIQLESLIDLIAQEHRELRNALDGWISRLDERIGRLDSSIVSMSASMQVSVERVIVENSETAERLQQARLIDQRVAETVVTAGDALGRQIESLKGELQTASSRGVLLVGRGAMILALVGGLAWLTAALLSFVRPSVADATATATDAEPTVAMPVPPAVPATDVPEGVSDVTVVEGDTLYKVGQSHGTSLEAMIKANPELRNPNELIIGQKVHLPK